ncbi:unnamed protein product [Rotaria sp. Silwood2]|nr:unnamed protein product [Rotaria sp. Silwood2]CAF4482128.1 unnamed protein product [Rotaria sp. Silwood2]
MSNDSTDRTIKGGVWVLKEEYDIDNIILKDELLSDYMIALMEVAAADGVLSEAERQWVIGLACAIGSSQVVIDKLQTYQHKGMDSVLATFHAESGHSNGIHRQLSLIYDGFRAAGADGELHPKEVEAIHELAKALGVGEAQRRNKPTTTTSKNSPPILPETKSTTATNTAPPTLKQQTKKKETLLVDIPCTGRPTSMLGKKLIKIAAKVRPEIKIQPIPRPPPTIQDLLPQKDPIQKDLHLHLVYEITCHDCEASYIGKIIRQATRRHYEHDASIGTNQPDEQNCDSQPIAASDTTLRRSDRLESAKQPTYSSLDNPTTNETADYSNIKSALHDHELEHGHQID